MKAILNILLLLLTVVILSQCEKDEPNPEVKIPDNNFLNALIALGIDTNGDGVISTAEAEVITSLNVNNWFIQDLKGIESFINLDTLYCMNNHLTTLDISNCTALKWLSCSNNQLSILDVSNNTTLEELFCYNNQLTTLDVSNNTILTILSCGLNQLTALDVSNNNALEKISCIDNQITSLDVSDCIFPAVQE
ncbi:Internalin J [subsurface metagenome]